MEIVIEILIKGKEKSPFLVKIIILAKAARQNDRELQEFVTTIVVIHNKRNYCYVE